MNKYHLIVVVLGGGLLVTILAIDPRRKNSSSGLHHATSAETRRFPWLLPEIRHADSANGAAHFSSIGSAETDKEILTDVIRKAALSGNVGLWEHALNHELRLLLRSNPRAAASLALSLDPGPIREQMLRRVAQDWTSLDATAALGWADGLTDALERNCALADVCVQMAQSNPAQAANAATQYGLVNAGGCLESIVQQWAETDLSSAFTWVSQFAAGAARDGMMARLAFVIAQVSPADAANVVANEISPGSVRVEATISVLHQWALQDSTAAAAWAAQFPEGELSDRAKQELAGLSEYRRALGK